MNNNLLKSPHLKSLPIIVIDLTEKSNTNQSSRVHSGNSISLREFPENQSSRCFYAIVGASGISKELAGFSFPCDKRTKEKAYYFNKLPETDFKNIIEFSISKIAEHYPIFFKTFMNNRGMFFLFKVPITKNEKKEIVESFATSFIGFAPIAIFIRDVAGEYSWHTDAYTQILPSTTHGYMSHMEISHTKVLKEMEKIPFHTTIAFVPWNFDRSDPSVVNLFKNNPHRFSISFHGNNHDHEEFASNSPIETHEKNIKQALARVDEFRKQTGLEYDRAMVFPHRIAALQVIDLLRKYSFSCTTSLQYRLDSVESKRSAHLWGGFVAEEEGIPSLKRESPYTSKEYLAILLFLQTPVLLHTHQNYFVNGVAEFSKVAITVNELRPDIQWVGLGSLCENLHLKKLEDDGKYPILLFGNKITLQNNDQHNRRFQIEKSHPAKINIREIWVNGTQKSFTNLKDKIQFEISIDGFDKATIQVEYQDETDVIEPVDVRKNNPIVRILRYVSDFRGIVIGQTSVGRSFTKAYYELSNDHHSETVGVILFGNHIMVGFLIAFMVTRLRALREEYRDRFRKIFNKTSRTGDEAKEFPIVFVLMRKMRRIRHRILACSCGSEIKSFPKSLSY